MMIRRGSLEKPAGPIHHPAMSRYPAMVVGVAVFAHGAWLMDRAFRPELAAGTPGQFHAAVATTGYFGIVVAGLIWLFIWGNRPDSRLAGLFGGAAALSLGVIAAALHAALCPTSLVLAGLGVILAWLTLRRRVAAPHAS